MFPSTSRIRLIDQGATASLNSVRNHLGRLADQNNWLMRVEDGRFMISPQKLGEIYRGTVLNSPDDDIPF